MTAKKNCDQYTNHREVILLYKVKSLALNNNQSIKQSKISARLNWKYPIAVCNGDSQEWKKSDYS